MGKLVFTAITSLDGYIEDELGRFDWAAPDEQVHAFANDLERRVSTHLYGRRLYDTMVYWETADELPDQSPVEADYTAVWKAADKVVFSRTLDTVSSARTRLLREFDPEAVRRMKDAADGDLAIGGPELAAQALRAGLVDELQLLLSPVVVGGGKPALPDGLRLDLELLDERRFDNGVTFLRYAVH